MKILIASHNKEKINEIREILAQTGIGVEIITIGETGIDVGTLPEPHDDYRKNSISKARFIFDLTEIPTLAEDSGLEVPALNNEPGPYSSNYAKIHGEKDNIKFLLKRMEKISSREAKFVCWLSFIPDKSKYYLFYGEMNGRISEEPRGCQGFGYDPVFIPHGYKNTLGELGSTIKNTISHRRKAIEKFCYFLLRSKMYSL